VQEFQDDDAGYLAWVQQHPDGFVLNTERRPSPNYLILHRTQLPHRRMNPHNHARQRDPRLPTAEQCPIQVLLRSNVGYERVRG
jgi:hypothetical protein